jgi:hypothetical protein
VCACWRKFLLLSRYAKVHFCTFCIDGVGTKTWVVRFARDIARTENILWVLYAFWIPQRQEDFWSKIQTAINPLSIYRLLDDKCSTAVTSRHETASESFQKKVSQDRWTASWEISGGEWPTNMSHLPLDLTRLAFRCRNKLARFFGNGRNEIVVAIPRFFDCGTSTAALLSVLRKSFHEQPINSFFREIMMVPQATPLPCARARTRATIHEKAQPKKERTSKSPQRQHSKNILLKTRIFLLIRPIHWAGTKKLRRSVPTWNQHHGTKPNQVGRRQRLPMITPLDFCKHILLKRNHQYEQENVMAVVQFLIIIILIGSRFNLRHTKFPNSWCAGDRIVVTIFRISKLCIECKICSSSAAAADDDVSYYLVLLLAVRDHDCCMIWMPVDA